MRTWIPGFACSKRATCRVSSSPSAPNALPENVTTVRRSSGWPLRQDVATRRRAARTRVRMRGQAYAWRGSPASATRTHVWKYWHMPLLPYVACYRLRHLRSVERKREGERQWRWRRLRGRALPSQHPPADRPPHHIPEQRAEDGVRQPVPSVDHPAGANRGHVPVHDRLREIEIEAMRKEARASHRVRDVPTEE